MYFIHNLRKVIKDTDLEILFANHDLRNNIGIAIFYLELLTRENSSLQQNEYIEVAEQVLNTAMILTEVIAGNSPQNKPIDEKHSTLILTSVQNQSIKYSGPDYQKMKGKYPIEINDRYDLLDDHIFIDIDRSALSRLNIILSPYIDVKSTANLCAVAT
jgi:hypothetical protein